MSTLFANKNQSNFRHREYRRKCVLAQVSSDGLVTVQFNYTMSTIEYFKIL